MSLVGKTLNRYEMVSLLGEGGMGAVYKGHDVTLERDVAIKIMHSQHARKADFRERFLQEARASARMDHPGIVKVFDFGQSDGILYIVMEFIAGENLRELLQGLRASESWLTMSEALTLVRQLAQALNYIHQQGVLHRDIKPANVMLKPADGELLPYRPVLTDLGLARLLEGQGMTETGTSMGTPMYMSPEQALGRKTDARSDVYSLGILLYELVVGQPPFPIKNLADAVNYHPSVAPPSPKSLRPEVPDNLEKAILFALNKEPKTRFPDAASFSKALELVGPDVHGLEESKPSLLESSVNLMTQFQKSLLDMRGASVLQDFPAAPAAPADRIQVMTGGKVIHDHEFRGAEMVLGRGADCDIVLNSNNVSRRHVRIQNTGSGYRVTDLNSTNGTFLDEDRLLPGVGEPWTPNRALTLGEFHVRWVAAVGQEPTAQYPMGILQLSQTVAETEAPRTEVDLIWARPTIHARPGEAQQTSLTVINTGAAPGYFEFGVEGIPAHWILNPPPPMQLMPGDRAPITLTLQAPKGPEARPGQYPLTVRVYSQADPQIGSHVSGSLTLESPKMFGSQVQPERAEQGEPIRVSIRNASASRENYQIGLSEPTGRLQFQPPAATVTAEPGGGAHAEFRVIAPQPLLGASKSYAFLIDLKGPGGQSKSHSSTVSAKPRLPLWTLPIFLIACLACVAVVGYGSTLFGGASGIATQTTIAQNMTATWSAENADTDADGLTDLQEIELGTTINDRDSDDDGVEDLAEVDAGTNPMHWDSDDDGLSDGDEIVKGTDPLNPDSDGDGWSDGEEVNTHGTDPALADTDGDGVDDAQDPDPGQQPTETPSPTPEPSLTPTQEATATTAATQIPTHTPTATATQTPVLAGGGFITYKVDDGSVSIYLQPTNGGPIELIGGKDDAEVLDYTPHKGGRFVIWVLEGGNENIYIVRQDGEILASSINEGWDEIIDADWSLDANRLVVEALVGGNPAYFYYQANGNLQGQGIFPP
jgi:serine/threonine protein kinase